MANFFEKLKKGMEYSDPAENEIEEKKAAAEEKKIKKSKKAPSPKPIKEKRQTLKIAAAFGGVPPTAGKIESPVFAALRGIPKPQRIKKEEIYQKEEKKKDKSPVIEIKETIEEPETEEEAEEKVEEKENKKENKISMIEKGKSWFEPEGQLTVDVYETEKEVVIRSAIAGVKPEDLDIAIENDMVIIKGKREQYTEESEKNYFYQECYWGRFSREIVLPEEVDSSRVEATMKDGILTIRIPKIIREKNKKINVNRQ